MSARPCSRTAPHRVLCPLDAIDASIHTGTATVIAAMKKYDVKRVAVVTSIGAGDSKDQAPFMFKMLMMTVMSSVSAWKLRVDGVGARKLISTQVHLRGQEQPGGPFYRWRRRERFGMVHRAPWWFDC
jgi:hypothetical protein